MSPRSLTPSRHTCALCYATLNPCNHRCLVGATCIAGSLLNTGGHPTKSLFQWSFVPELIQCTSGNPLDLAVGWPTQDWQPERAGRGVRRNGEQQASPVRASLLTLTGCIILQGQQWPWKKGSPQNVLS